MKLARFLLIAMMLAVPVTQVQAQSPSPEQAQARMWFVRLLPPRATFMTDMTNAESALMQQHFAYWKEQYAKGTLVFGGPVLDPRGVFGVIVLRATTEDEARAIASADPSVRGGVNKIDVAEMRVAFPPKTE
jgi:Uncharacterized protein conserved in bacteria